MKRCLDILASAALLVAGAPLLLVLAALVRWRLGSPVLFRQVRIGWKERPFVLVKFRSMRDATRPDGSLLPDGDRLTPFGEWLRGCSLDELPQLWNVLKGDMSFIGPRPLLPEYLPRYSARHRKRHNVRPGLSGLAQISGRNALGWERRFDLDVEYVEKQHLWLDLKIALRTLRKLVAREGISQPGEATMTEFRGSNPVGEPALIIYGCGTQGRAIVEMALASGRHAAMGLTDDDERLWGTPIFGITVTSPEEAFAKGPCRFVCAIGDNEIRGRIHRELRQAGHQPETVASPASLVSPSATIGKGSILMGQAIVNTEASVGDGCLLNSSCIVEHHCTIGDFAHIAPGAALGGGATVEEYAFVGIGAIVLPQVTIGAGSVLGAGAVAIRDVPRGAVVVGNPAKILRISSPV